MTAVLLVEAIDTFFAICDAILAWIAVLSAVVTVVLFTLVLTGATAWRAVRRRHTPASRPQSPSRDSRVLTQAPSAPQGRTAPSWAQPDPEQQEAA